MNSSSAERKRRLLILRNQRLSVPGLHPRPETDSADDPALIEDFRIACGTQGLPRLSIGRADHSTDDCFVLEKPYAVLGRSPECDIQLYDPDVSFRHAYLQLVNGRLLCIDLVSNSGTYFGERPKHSAWLDAGATASIGPYVLRYLGNQQDEFEEAEACKQSLQSDRPNLTISDLSRTDQSHDRPERLPDVSLVFLNARRESSQQNIRQIKRPITLVGGSRACKFTLVDETVSRVHCSFVLTPQGLWIVDLIGREGTRVDGDLIEHQRLEDGSVVSVGRFRFQVRYDTHENSQTWAAAAQLLTAFPSSSADEAAPEASDIVNGGSAIVIADDDSTVSALSTVGSAPPTATTEIDDVPDSSLARPDTARPPSAVSVPAGAELSGRFSEEFVLSLMEQFAAMQQQMFDQSQQQMLMLTQMFGAMYQTQQDLVRDELQQIHTLNTEMQRVQARLLEEQVTVDNANSPTAESSESGPSKGITAQTSPLPSDPQTGMARDEVEGEAEAAPPIQEPQTAPPTNVAAPTAAAESTAEIESVSDETSDSVEEQPRSRADVDTHAWLAERMEQLEQERSSRWKRILQTLSGTGPQS